MMMKPLQIGNLCIDRPVILAPMAGVTDLPFRVLCREQGCGMVCTEMVSAKAITYKNKNTFLLMETVPQERPVSLQLFGSDPKIMSSMAAKIEERPFDLLDINMGCPVPKIVNNHEGSALMKDPVLAGKIIEATVKAIKKPVTVKIRKGFDDDHINAVEIAKIIEDAGGAAVAVHGRTREQYYSGKADWEIIRQVKEAVSIPVIGNGDVISGEKALQMRRETGCDGVMIGRGALGDPWLFERVNAALTGGAPPPEPTLNQRMAALRAQIYEMCEEKGEWAAMPQARSQAMHYMKGLRGAAALRRYCSMLEHFTDVDKLIDAVYKLQ